MYHGLSEEEQNRIANWLIINTGFEAGGWMIRGIVHLEWSNGWFYIVEMENQREDSAIEHEYSAHLVPIKE